MMHKYELLEWRDGRYVHVRYLNGTDHEAKLAQDKLNEGYSGPRYIIQRVTK